MVSHGIRKRLKIYCLYGDRKKYSRPSGRVTVTLTLAKRSPKEWLKETIQPWPYKGQGPMPRTQESGGPQFKIWCCQRNLPLH